MAKVRLAHIVNQLYFAGKEAGIIKISSAMDKSLFDVDIVVLGKIHQDEKMRGNGIRSIELNKKPGNDPKVVFRMAQVFRENAYDIIYTHAWNTLIEGYVAAKLAGVPIKIHGEHGTFERSRLKDKLQPLIWERFDAVTTVAADLKTRMKDLFSYRKDNIQVVYNGIDAQRYYPSNKLRDAFRTEHAVQDKFVVGTVGRFHPIKDHFTLMKGFALFQEKVPEAELLLVGGEKNGKMISNYQNQVDALKLQGKIHFLPTTPEVTKVFNGFDTFVLSSISEGCSNVILEAMACGVPVVATRTGGNPELVQDQVNGLLFDVGSAEQLADRLLNVYKNKDLRKRFQNNGPSFIHENFTLETTVSNYQNLYLRLLERSNQRAA